MAILRDRNNAHCVSDPTHGRIKFFESFFYLKLYEREGLKGGFVCVSRILNQGLRKLRVGPFDYYTKWIIPVHVLGCHWALMVVRLEAHEIHFYDSLPNLRVDRATIMAHTLQFVKHAAREANRLDIADQPWSCEIRESPRQYKDGTDCGLFAILNAERETLGLTIDGNSYTHDDMYDRNVRNLVACEILKYRPQKSFSLK